MALQTRLDLLFFSLCYFNENFNAPHFTDCGLDA